MSIRCFLRSTKKLKIPRLRQEASTESEIPCSWLLGPACMLQRYKSLPQRQHWERENQKCCSTSALRSSETASVPSSYPMPANTTYRIEVVTGNVRGAGSSEPAILQLIGECGQSGEFVIGKESEDIGFERGSKQRYSFQIEKELGDLRRVLIQQVETGTSEPGSGWYLDQVVVTSPEGAVWHCPCNSWIGKVDADGLVSCMERNLIPIEILHPDDVPKAENLEVPLKVTSGAISIPHPEKLASGGAKAVNRKHEGWGGEDAYFCTPGRSGIFALGVADGVYMWKTKGIDSGHFSKTLMMTAHQLIISGVDDVVKIMQKLEKRICKEDIKGSSTACLVVIDTVQGRLSSANLGDSGFLVLGKTQPGEANMPVKYHSPQQEHQFGFPYQLGHYEGADSADSAMLMTLAVASGDIVIMGSDGLWDNIAISDITLAVSDMQHRSTRPSAIAQYLASRAFEAAMDKKGVTPYSLGATEAFDMVYSGGKADDITVVVTQML